MAKRNALITGGMGGLGESISTKMHDAGFNVVVTHSPANKKAAAWVADYKGKGYSFAAYGVDVADSNPAGHAWQRCKTKWVRSTSWSTMRASRAT